MTNSHLDTAIEILIDMLNDLPTLNIPVLFMGDTNIDPLRKLKGNTKFNELLATNIPYRLALPAVRITHSTASPIDCACTNIVPHKIDIEVIHTGL